uniref:Uncharacterized protein n=1 Tax=viral metagenome TaxID=1070528 RepID=A0A6C0ADB7_9ZZZZ
MGSYLSKNDNSENKNIERIINLLLDKDLNGCLFEKYIDIFLFLANYGSLSFKEKNFKYSLKGHKYFITLFAQRNNESPVRILEICNDKASALSFFMDLNLKETIDFEKFIDIIKEIKRIFIDSNEISEYDVHILNKKNIELETANISKIEKMIEIESIKNNIKNLTYLEKLDKLEIFFAKMSKSIDENSILIPEAIEIVNSKIASAPEERNFVVTKAVKFFNH